MYKRVFKRIIEGTLFASYGAQVSLISQFTGLIIL